jgi:predicted acylesterase/phospholipase RssA
MEQGQLPRIIAGSSVGSIVAAIAGVHTDKELRTMYANMNLFDLSFFANNSTLSALFHLFRKGSLQGAIPSCTIRRYQRFLHAVVTELAILLVQSVLQSGADGADYL